MNSFKKNKTYHIGLVDADLLCNGTRHPNLALLKIAGYLRDNGYALKTSESDFEGNTYELLTNECNFEKLQELDHIYISCVFSFTLDDPPLLLESLLSNKKLANKVHMGGTGSYANLSIEEGFAEKREADMHLLENDKFLNTLKNKFGSYGIDMRRQMPDYHLYDEFIGVMENIKKSPAYYKDYKEYSIGFLTRGCFRRCPFCVNKLERKAMPYSNLNDFLDNEIDENTGKLKRPYIYLWDDNFLASPYWEQLLDELIATKRPFQFRQGLDERLLAQHRRGEDMAKKLASANYHGDFIFAFDSWFDRKLIVKALKIWKYYCPKKETKFYLFCGFRPGSSNSLTLSWLLIDEAKFIDYDKLKDETLPANGGIRSYFGHHSFNHSMMVLSDMPQTTKGSWFLHYEQKMDKELIDTIKGTIYKIWQTKDRIASLKAAHQPVPSYLPSYLKWLDQSLNKMRSVAVYYKEYSTLENLQLLGEEYIRQMKRDLTPKTFQTSILCQKIGISHDGFYSSMQEWHKYDASDFGYLDSLGYDRIIEEAQQERYSIRSLSNFSSLHSSLDCRTDADIDPMSPLCIGMDYNANINWIVCGQPRGNRLNVLKSFYVKFERKIPALIADFCTYYAPHANHMVIFYYDATALGSNYAVNDQDFHWVVVHEFERHGWQVQDVYLGNPMRHDEKYLLINQGFAGKQRLMPYFNRQNNDDLILAIQSAGVERGRNGFRKNKSTEKNPESEEDLLQHRTDGTDAFDTLYIGCEKFPQHDFYGGFTVGGVR